MGGAADKLQVLVLPAVACLFTGTPQQCIWAGPAAFSSLAVFLHWAAFSALTDGWASSLQAPSPMPEIQASPPVPGHGKGFLPQWCRVTVCMQILLDQQHVQMRVAWQSIIFVLY